MASGVYQIRNTINGKVYVGGAVSINRRWNVHRCELRKGKHRNARLQNAFNKYGEGAFVLEVLEYCVPEAVCAREQHFLDVLKPQLHGYNLSSQAYLIRLGARLCPESIARMRAKLVGRGKGVPKGPMPEVTKRKLSAALKGKSHSDETRRKIGLASSRHPRSPQWRQRISEAQRGKIITAEQRKKISATLSGRRQSAATCARRRASLLAHPRCQNSLRCRLGAMLVKESIALRATGLGPWLTCVQLGERHGIKPRTVYNIIHNHAQI